MKQPKFLIAGAVTATVAAFFFAKEIRSADSSTPKTTSQPVYSVSEYDPKRDPAKDLADTVAIAKKDGRRILLLVGGDW
jgi:hypothetical protein